MKEDANFAISLVGTSCQKVNRTACVKISYHYVFGIFSSVFEGKSFFNQDLERREGIGFKVEES